MRRSIAFVILSLGILTFCACNNEPNDNFTLRGKVTGLKKGILYLQKEVDTSIIDLDSMVIKGEPEFLLSTTLDEPMVLYLKLFKNDGEEHYIPFFADKGETYITTNLDNFSFDATIKGSKQQEVLENYLKVMSQFNNRNLDLIKQSFLAQKAKDTVVSDSLQSASNQLLKRKYAYTINFALNNSNSEVAPYLALYEIPNANKKFLDSIYGNLNDTIKSSYYGIKLKSALDQSVEN